MTKRNRVFAAILLAYAIGVALLMWRLLADIDPRYRESAEESLVEVAHLVAAQIEQRWHERLGLAEPAIDVGPLEPLFRDLYARQLDAEIFGFRKTQIELRLTVVDAGGRVVFDSLGRAVGADHSQWRDVKLALEGRYGARTTPDVAGEPATSVMYVAAPLRRDGAIVGAVSVGKPAQSFGQFVEAARRKTIVIGMTSVVAVAILVLLLSAWLVRPFGFIADYVRYVRAERSFSLPRLSRRALGTLGAAYDEMRDALAGRNYVADYVQTLTHELKSPLSAIRGAAELLHEPSMPAADRARFVANIERETMRIQALVDRMMELAALESRRVLAHTESVAMRTLVEERVASAQAAGAPRRIAVTLAAMTTPRSTATRCSCSARSATCSTTRSTSRPKTVRSRYDSASPAAASKSACATTAPASPTMPTTRCSKSSTRWRARTASARAPAWACPSCARSRRSTAGASRCATRKAAARWRCCRCRWARRRRPEMGRAPIHGIVAS